MISCNCFRFQEILFERLWHSSGAGVKVDVELSRLEGSPLTCRLVAQQIGSTNTQTLRINSDFPYAPVTSSQLANTGKYSKMILQLILLLCNSYIKDPL